MNNEVMIRNKKEEDAEKILEVVNSFVKDSFAAYSDEYYPPSIVDEHTNHLKVVVTLECLLILSCRNILVKD